MYSKALSRVSQSTDSDPRCEGTIMFYRNHRVSIWMFVASVLGGLAAFLVALATHEYSIIVGMRPAATVVMLAAALTCAGSVIAMTLETDKPTPNL